MEIKFFQKSNNRKPVEEFLDKLSTEDDAKISGCLENVEELGFDSPRVTFRQIRGKLWEIKILAPSGKFRFFYATVLKGKVLVLLHAILKKSGKTPKKDLELSEKRMKEVLNNESFYT